MATWSPKIKDAYRAPAKPAGDFIWWNLDVARSDAKWCPLPCRQSGDKRTRYAHVEDLVPAWQHAICVPQKIGVARHIFFDATEMALLSHIPYLPAHHRCSSNYRRCVGPSGEWVDRGPRQERFSARRVSATPKSPVHDQARLPLFAVAVKWRSRQLGRLSSRDRLRGRAQIQAYAFLAWTRSRPRHCVGINH